MGFYGRGLSTQPELLRKYAPDILADRYLMLLSEYHWVPLTILAIILYAAGGWPFVLWAIFFRVSPEPARHLARQFRHAHVGRPPLLHARRLAQPLVGRTLNRGEGWHNNHHAYPVSARHGLAWYEYDLNYYCIWIMGKLGLARQSTPRPFRSARRQTTRRIVPPSNSPARPQTPALESGHSHPAAEEMPHAAPSGTSTPQKKTCPSDDSHAHARSSP